MGCPGYDRLESSPEFFSKRGNSGEYRESRPERPEVIEQGEPTMEFDAGVAATTEGARDIGDVDASPSITCTLHGSYDDDARTRFIAAQATDARVIRTFLRIPPEVLRGTMVHFEVFETREAKQRADPLHSASRASARFREMTVYRVWNDGEDPHFPHELTHLIAHRFGHPYRWEVEVESGEGHPLRADVEMVSTSFMQEGLAIAVDEMVFHRPWARIVASLPHLTVEVWCHALLREHTHVIDLTSIINFAGFTACDQQWANAFAASITKFLLLRFGTMTYRTLYAAVREDRSPAENVRQIETVTGMSEREIMEQWRAFMETASIET